MEHNIQPLEIPALEADEEVLISRRVRERSRRRRAAGLPGNVCREGWLLAQGLRGVPPVISSSSKSCLSV